LTHTVVYDPKLSLVENLESIPTAPTGVGVRQLDCCAAEPVIAPPQLRCGDRIAATDVKTASLVIAVSSTTNCMRKL